MNDIRWMPNGFAVGGNY